MFGMFRYILALGVVTTHLWPGSLRWAGYYSVFAFFMLSGYLMTLVLNERYGFSADGLRRFFANRALRIYPPYLVVLAFALVLAALVPELALNINRLVKVPASAVDWLSNIFIFGAWFDRSLTHARVVPPVWSLHVELFFYLAMGLLLSRSVKTTSVWFIASVGYTAYALYSGMDFISRYYTVPAGSLAFSCGALIYHLRNRLAVPAWVAAPAAAAFLANVLFAKALWGSPKAILTGGFYVSVALTAVLIVTLRRIKPGAMPSWVRRADGLLGDLSYPVFLIHWNVAIVVVWLWYSGVRPPGGELMLVSLPLINVGAWILNVAVEKRMEGVRDGLRERRRPWKALQRRGGVKQAPLPLTFGDDSDTR